MPKKSSNSVRHDAAPRDEVLAALMNWVSTLRSTRPEVLRAGVFGSYSRGDYGPASDVDVFLEVSESPHRRWFDRPVDFTPPREIPVGVELFIYTAEEIARMSRENSPWFRQIFEEMVWL